MLPDKLCIRPWHDLHLWEGCSTVCCWKEPYLFSTPYKAPPGVWKHEQLLALRRTMLEGGVQRACPQCPIYIGDLNREIAEHIRQYPAAPWDTVARNNVLKNQSASPLVTSILVGDKCNSNCRMCWLRTKEKIDTGRFDADSIKELQKLCEQTAYITFSGGDLFAYEDEYIDAMCSVSSTATREAITNAQGLTIDRINKYVLSGKIPRLKISLETVQPDNYSRHCGRPIGDLLSRLRYLNGRNVVWYSNVITLWTLPGLPDLVRFAAETNVKWVGMKPISGTVLASSGYGFADVFGEGFSEQIHAIALDIFAQTEELAKQYNIHVEGLDLARGRLEKARGQRLLQ